MKHSLNRYLYAVRLLKKKQGRVSAADIARCLGVKPPSVCVALRQLLEQGYIQKEQDGSLALSPAGTVYTDRLHERIVFFSQLLSRIGVDSATARQDAFAFSWEISDASYEAFRDCFRTGTEFP